jgi:hypothetical protein
MGVMPGENGVVSTGSKSGKPIRRNGKGFRPAGALARAPIRDASGKRGFAEVRVLTDWDAILGESLARSCRPVKVTHHRGADLGATLVVLAEGARAPEVEMLAPRIVERVNGYYGYRAISRVSVTQIAGGMAETSREFDRRGAPERPRFAVTEEQAAEIDSLVADVKDPGLRAALDRLGRNICIKRRTPAAGNQ